MAVHRLLRRLGVVAASALLLTAVTGCSGVVALSAAASANDPGCAAIIVRLPEDLGDGLTLRQTDAQATAAWGDPSAVILRCGVTPPGPTTTPCVEADGVDWLVDDSQAPTYVFTTYGRTPATEVVVDSTRASGDVVLSALAGPVSQVEQQRTCVSLEDATAAQSSAPPG